LGAQSDEKRCQLLPAVDPHDSMKASLPSQGIRRGCRVAVHTKPHKRGSRTSHRRWLDKSTHDNQFLGLKSVDATTDRCLRDTNSLSDVASGHSTILDEGFNDLMVDQARCPR
jgi:hypothetical protein